MNKIYGNDRVKIKHTIHPLPMTLNEKIVVMRATNFIFFFFLIVGISLIPVGSIIFIIMERESYGKHQQWISGVNMTDYWVSNFIWDYIK